jgi:hypothetical protein
MTLSDVRFERTITGWFMAILLGDPLWRSLRTRIALGEIEVNEQA